MIHRPRYSAAFTLVELMISLFMVVLLMVGINMVFKLSSDTVGMGQAAIGMSRDNRSVQSIMQDDASKWLKDAPAFVIVNELVKDQNNPSILHRRDYFAFPANGLFHRQTGWDDNSYVSTSASYEAWIWYGSTFPVPVLGSPNNGIPSNVVGRMAMLMRDQPSFPNNGENYFPRSTSVALSPLGINTFSTKVNAKRAYSIFESRYDLAGGTLVQLRQDIGLVRPIPDDGTSPVSSNQSINWWQPLIYRFQCNTKLPKPMTPADVAQATPFLVGNCSEFIVEFAGDYFKQDPNTADVLYDKNNPTLTDGEIDFDWVRGQGSNIPNRQIRWYGLDRRIVDDGQQPILRGSGDVFPAYVVANSTLTSREPNIYFERPPMPGFTQKNQYIAVWANQAPKLVRITMKLDDPTGRIQDGQWVQFILGPQ